MDGALAGGGTFNFASATITNQGTVAPGVSPGILTVNGNLPLTAVSRFDVEMNGFTAGTNHPRKSSWRACQQREVIGGMEHGIANRFSDGSPCG